MTAAEIQRALYELAQSGGIPGDLGGAITPEGNIRLLNPDTGQFEDYSPFYIQELRPYLAAISPTYAATYFRQSYAGPVAGGGPITAAPIGYTPPTGPAPPNVTRLPGDSGAIAPPVRASPIGGFIGGGGFGLPSINVVGIVTGALGDIFGGAGVALTNPFLFQYQTRSALKSIAEALTRFVSLLSRLAGLLASLIHAIWVSVLRPILEKLRAIARAIDRLNKRVLQPVLKWIRRIREIIRQYYDKYIRPILRAIEIARRVLLILRLFHIRWAEKLDARLRRLEAKVFGPVAWILGWLGWLERWIATIQNLPGLLNRAVFVNSLYFHQADLVNTWWNAQDDPSALVGEPTRDELRAARQARFGDGALRTFLETGAGPMAEYFAESNARVARNFPDLAQQAPRLPWEIF